MSAILESQIVINRNGFMQGTFWHKIGRIPFKGSWVIVIFMFVLFLVTAPMVAILDSQLAQNWNNSF